jgi:trehalose synthase
VEPNVHVRLEEYSALPHLSGPVASLISEARNVAASLRDRTIWMVNSTAEGGGVAELLPTQIAMLRQLGLDVRWAVLEADAKSFFPFTKRLHNLIHAGDEPPPARADLEVYEAVSRTEANVLAEAVRNGDIVIVHDPQPLALGAFLREQRAIRTIWRCHIGVDEETAGTNAAWQFLQPYTASYCDVVFSMDEYVPAFLRADAHIIHPSIDPLAHKNRDLSLHKLVGILGDADLIVPDWPLIAPPFEHRAQRLLPNGAFAPANTPEDIGLLGRPVVTQVSRWDRLKGFGPLLQGFAEMKRNRARYPLTGERHGNRLAAARLVLAGADPTGIEDDPETLEVFRDLCAQYARMPVDVQRDVAIVALPIASRNENALMVNALQRVSDIVVQNSLREGFGLTVSEAMWKRTPILGSATACGVRLQVRDRIDGRLVHDPEDVHAIASVLAEMLGDSDRLEEWGRSGQRRVHENFLIFSELSGWLGLLSPERSKK